MPVNNIWTLALPWVAVYMAKNASMNVKWIVGHAPLVGIHKVYG